MTNPITLAMIEHYLPQFRQQDKQYRHIQKRIAEIQGAKDGLKDKAKKRIRIAKKKIFDDIQWERNNMLSDIASQQRLLRARDPFLKTKIRRALESGQLSREIKINDEGHSKSVTGTPDQDFRDIDAGQTG